MHTQLPFPAHHAGQFRSRVKVHGKHNTVPDGMFNVNAEYDWIIGGNIPDEREHTASTNYQVYHAIKPNTRRKYF